MFRQLCALERRQGRSGKPTVDHPPGGSDDAANAVCGALMPTAKPTARTRVSSIFGGEVLFDSDDTPAQAAQRERRRAAAEGEEYRMPSVFEGIHDPRLFGK